MKISMTKKTNKTKERSVQPQRELKKTCISILLAPTRGRIRNMLLGMSQPSFPQKMFLLNTKVEATKFLFPSSNANLKRIDFVQMCLFSCASSHQLGILYQQLMKNSIKLSDVAKLRAEEMLRSGGGTLNEEKWMVKKQAKKNGIKESQRREKVELFGDVGLSTLMDISMSSIGEKSENRGKGLEVESKRWERQQFEKKMKSEVEQMRQKLRMLHQQSAKLDSIDYRFPSQNGALDFKQERYLKQIRWQINKERIKKGISTIMQMLIRQFLRSLGIMDMGKSMLEKKRRQVQRRVFVGWAEIVAEEGETKRLMEAIRNRIIVRRKLRETKQMPGPAESVQAQENQS